jgi:hypothetical protein
VFVQGCPLGRVEIVAFVVDYETDIRPSGSRWRRCYRSGGRKR